MTIHFDNHAAAAAHLVANGWHQISNGNWVSHDGSCAAAIRATQMDAVVCLQVWEVA